MRTFETDSWFCFRIVFLIAEWNGFPYLPVVAPRDFLQSASSLLVRLFETFSFTLYTFLPSPHLPPPRSHAAACCQEVRLSNRETQIWRSWWCSKISSRLQKTKPRTFLCPSRAVKCSAKCSEKIAAPAVTPGPGRHGLFFHGAEENTVYWSLSGTHDAKWSGNTVRFTLWVLKKKQKTIKDTSYFETGF